MPKRKTKKHKRKKVVKKKPQDSVHVMLVNSISKRRDLVNVTIETVQLLKRADKIKEIQVEKRKELNNFRDKWKEIHKLLRLIRLKELPLRESELDDVRDPSGRKILQKVTKPLKKKVVKKVKVEKPKSTEFNKRSSIDEQLDALQRKLSNL
jgi:hypothetical protein